MAQQGNIAEHPLKAERQRRRERNVGSGPCLGTPSSDVVMLEDTRKAPPSFPPGDPLE